MKKRFRCGRLIVTRDGIPNKIDLKYGGGTRFCNLDHVHMSFKDVHYRLREIYRSSKMITGI
jgi:hypothetical protein